MKPYKTFSCHKTGTSHIEKKLVCEDYSSSYEDKSISVCVISDGHGDKNCFRSAVGARLACEIAIRQIRTLFSYGNETKDRLLDNSDIVLNQLEKSIIAEWTSRVNFHVFENPFTDSELSPLNEEMQRLFKSGSKGEKAYGCTLVLSAVTEYCWFGIQIGDGRCTAVFDDGVYLDLIPQDNEGCVGNRSASICASDSICSFRHYFGTVLPRAVFVTSDGIEESFSDRDLNKCYYTVSYWANTESFESLKQKINDLLPQISEGGSRDDVSLSFIIDPSYPAVPEKQSIIEINHRINICIENISKIKPRYEELSEIREEMLSENESINKKLSELENQANELKIKLDENNRRLSELKEVEQRYKKYSEQLEKISVIQKPAAMFWKNKNELLSLGIDDGEFNPVSEK